MNAYQKNITLIALFFPVILLSFSKQVYAEINSDGSLSYKFQIEVPQGINKVQPDLKISYNSNLPDGIAGTGWNIDGLPQISRINSGNGVHFDGNDTYLGMQGILVDISGNKKEYHTKNESFYRYQPIYGTCNLSSAEPCGWIVNSPDGYTMYFGEDENGSNGNSRVLSGNRLGFKAWSLRKVSDLHHNEYLVKYKINQGVMYPETIIYNTSGFRYRVIRFNYEDRTDVERKYHNGALEIISQRLKSVEVASNALCFLGYCTDGDLVRMYKLGYKYSQTTLRSLLTQLQEFGTDGVTSLPPVNFVYSEPDTTKTDSAEILVADFKESLTADINGDSLTDLVRFSDTGSQISIGYQLSNGQPFGGQSFQPVTGIQSFAMSGWKLSLADLNGDGQKDLVFVKGKSVMYSLWVNSSWSSTLSIANSGDANAIGWSISATDINMDGIDDLVYTYNYYDNSTPSCAACAKKLQIDVQFNSPVNSRMNSLAAFSPVQTIFEDNTLNAEWFVTPANLNSDSSLDFILTNYTGGVTVNYLLSDGNHYQAVKNAYTHSDPAAVKWMAIPSDFNGDGKTDLVYFSQNYDQINRTNRISLGYQIANENGFDSFVSYLAESRTDPYTVMPIDLNGDNKSDFLFRKYGTNYCQLMYSAIYNTESGAKTPIDYFSQTDIAGGSGCKMNLHLGDFNGDGVLDIVHTRFNGSAEDKIFFSFQKVSNVDKLTSMTNGYGSRISVEYKPVSLFSNAIKSDSAFYCGSLNMDYNGLCGLPFKAGRFLAFKETTSDGRSGNYVKTFQYENGRYKPGRAIDFKMIGFEKFTTKVEMPGYYSVQVFRQDGDYARYPAREEWYDGNHELVRTFDSAYDPNLSTIFNGTSWVKINKQTTTQYEAGQYAYTKSNQFIFNDYGQIIHIQDFAESTETIENFYTYAIDTGLWVLNRVVEQKQTAANQIVEWTKYIYQNQDKISEQKYLNTSQTWINHGFQYDIYGNIIAEIDPNGNVTKTVFDDIYHSVPIAQVNALGQTTTMEYDSLYYHAVRTTDPNHNVKGSEFDAVHRIVKTIYPSENSSDENYRQIVYSNTGDPNGQFLEIRYNNDSPEGYNYVKHYYDGLMRLYKKSAKGTIVNENGGSSFVDIITEYEFYDISEDKHSKESNPYLSNKNNRVYKTFTYDSLGRLIKATSPEGSSDTIVFAPNSITKYDSHGNTEKVKTDSREREISRENYEGVRLLSKIAYQVFPLKQISIDGDGHSITEIFNTLGKSVELNDSATGRWFYKYDNNGNIIEKIDPKTQSIFYTYDALNRILSKYANLAAVDTETENNGENKTETNKWSVNYSYDDASLQNSIGKLSHVIDETGRTTFGYDKNGNLSQMKKEIGGQVYSFSAKYNTEKKVTQINYPDGSFVTNHYTDAGYLRQVRYHTLNDTKPEGHPVISYLGPNDNNEILRITGNGVRDLVTYDIRSFKPLSVQTIAKDSAGADLTVRRLNYSMDSYGNIKSIINELEPAFSEYFQTDGLNRVTYAKGSYGENNYMYSAGGNLLQKGIKTLYYNDPLHPQSVTSDSLGNHYVYDQNGNTVREYNVFRCNSGDHEKALKSNSENEDCHSSRGLQNRQYFYNVENQLIKSSISSSGAGSDTGAGANANAQSRFYYDYNGLRTIKRSGGRTVYYFHFLSNTSPIYEVQSAKDVSARSNHSDDDTGHNTGLVTDHDKKHSLQTKYIYGSQSELVAQISSENVNFANVFKNTESVNYMMASNGNLSGLQGLTQGFVKNTLFLTAWLHRGDNGNKLFFVISFIVTAAFFIVFVYFTIVKYKILYNNYRQYRKNYRRLNPVYYFTLPVLLVTFVWQFGMGCGSFNSGAIPASTTDAAFWSEQIGTIPDDILKVSMLGPEPGQTWESDQNGGYPVSGTYFFHSDHLGSISMVTNVLGQIITELRYLPYGEIDRAHSYGPDILRYKYTHQEEDRESGKYNYNARMYNPESARFTTADTQLPGDGKMSQGFNRYMYAMGNPVKYNDPTGHCSFSVGGDCSTAPGYNYAGPTRRQQSMTAPCTTGIDCVARGHDNAGAVVFPIFLARANTNQAPGVSTVSMLLTNIIKDGLFKDTGLLVNQTGLGITASFMTAFSAGWNSGKSLHQSDIVSFFYGAGWAIVSIAYDTLIWSVGAILFVINIIIAQIAQGLAMIMGFLQGFDDWLSGRKSFQQIWNDFWRDVAQVVNDVVNTIVNFFNGLFGW